MIRLSQRVLATIAAVGVLLAPVAAQSPAPRKLISPQRGDATVEITKPDTKLVKNEVVTVIMVKNTSASPIAGLKIEENWYDGGGNPVGGGVYRHTKPLMKDEVIRVELRTPRSPKFKSNQYQFTHANGAVKPTVVKTLTASAPTM
jgi:hypothetical protein